MFSYILTAVQSLSLKIPESGLESVLFIQVYRKCSIERPGRLFKIWFLGWAPIQEGRV